MKLHFAPELIHVYGPLGIHSYGLFIALGIVISVLAMRKNKRFNELHLENSYLDIVIVSILAGCTGGRALEVISEPALYPTWQDCFALWEGGFSVLGSILGIIIILPAYLKKIGVSILPLFDLVAIYAPLLQSIARLGCFTAGCCYGVATTSSCGVIYTNPNTLAAYGIPVYPTQLYSSVLLFILFIFMYFIGQRIFTKKGELFSAYLIGAALERFVVDFWRAERIMVNSYLSFHQCVALSIIVIILLSNSIFTKYPQSKEF